MQLVVACLLGAPLLRSQCCWSVLTSRGCTQLSIGCVRARFAKHIAILILVDACASALGFFFFGYAFGFGDEKDQSASGAATGGAPGLTTTAGNPFVGTHFFGLHDMTPMLFASWLFQWSVRPCALLSGCRDSSLRWATEPVLGAYLVYACALLSLACVSVLLVLQAP